MLFHQNPTQSFTHASSCSLCASKVEDAEVCQVVELLMSGSEMVGSTPHDAKRGKKILLNFPRGDGGGLLMKNS